MLGVLDIAIFTSFFFHSVLWWDNPPHTAVLTLVSFRRILTSHERGSNSFSRFQYSSFTFSFLLLFKTSNVITMGNWMWFPSWRLSRYQSLKLGSKSRKRTPSKSNFLWPSPEEWWSGGSVALEGQWTWCQRRRSRCFLQPARGSGRGPWSAKTSQRLCVRQCRPAGEWRESWTKEIMGRDFLQGNKCLFVLTYKRVSF